MGKEFRGPLCIIFQIPMNLQSFLKMLLNAIHYKILHIFTIQYNSLTPRYLPKIHLNICI